MQGQSAVSIESARRVVANVRVEQVQAFPTVEFFRTVPLLSLVRFGKWDEILAEPHPHEGFMFAKSIWHYARGVAYAATGEAVLAADELALLLPLKDDVSVRFLDSRDYPGSTLVAIAIDLLQGEIAYRAGDYTAAEASFEQRCGKTRLASLHRATFLVLPHAAVLGRGASGGW